MAELLTPQPPEGPTASARKPGRTLSPGEARRAHRSPPLASSLETGLSGTPRLAGADAVEVSALTKQPALHRGSESPGLRRPEPSPATFLLVSPKDTGYLWLNNVFHNNPQNYCLKAHLLSSANKGKGTVCLTGRS